MTSGGRADIGSCSADSVIPAPNRPRGCSCPLPYWPCQRNATLPLETVWRPPRAEGAMRTAVVTGAARGLGRAMSARLVADGFAVWAVDTDSAAVAAIAASVGATPCALDVTDEAA